MNDEDGCWCGPAEHVVEERQRELRLDGMNMPSGTVWVTCVACQMSFFVPIEAVNQFVHQPCIHCLQPDAIIQIQASRLQLAS